MLYFGLLFFGLAQKSDAHFLLNVSALQDLFELIEADQVVLVQIRLHDRSLGDRHQLVLGDVGTDLQN